MRLEVHPAQGGVIFRVHVVPRASREEVAGLHGGALRIRLNAPPVDGVANAALVAFLAEKLAVPRARVEIVSGLTSRQKRVRVVGIDADQVRRLLF